MSAIESIRAGLFRKLFLAGARRVTFHKLELNKLDTKSINPGDTGTNFHLTLRGGISAFRPGENKTIADLLKSISRGAMLGSRGTSGLIVSQILTGFSRALHDADVLTGDGLKAAFEEAGKKAYQVIQKPREGTILTIISAIADGLNRKPNLSRDLVTALEFIHRSAVRTLSKHNPPDAGARGFAYFLEGMLQGARFESLQRRIQSRILLEMALNTVRDMDYRYWVEFIIEGEDFKEDEIRKILYPLGNSIRIKLNGDLLRLSLQTNHPEKVRPAMSRLGRIIRYRFEDLSKEHRYILSGRSISELNSSFDNLNTALAAVVNGDGLESVFGCSGAYVIPGGCAMNPGIKNILATLEKIPARDILLLPNNPDCISPCDLAAGMADRNVYVIPTYNPAQGLYMLEGYDPSLDISTLSDRCFQKREELSTIVITRARRDGSAFGSRMQQGEWLALKDGVMIEHDMEFSYILKQVLSCLQASPTSRITLIEGKEQVPKIHDLIRLFKERLEAEVNYIYGGQEEWQLLIGIEQTPRRDDW